MAYDPAREPSPNRATVLETSLEPWHRDMESFMAQGADIIALRGAGSANGIEDVAFKTAKGLIQQELFRRLADNPVRPIVLMYEGDPDHRNRPDRKPDFGELFGRLADFFAQEPRVTFIAVQTTDWHEPQDKTEPITSATGTPYKTYIFNKEMSDIPEELREVREEETKKVKIGECSTRH